MWARSREEDMRMQAPRAKRLFGVVADAIVDVLGVYGVRDENATKITTERTNGSPKVHLVEA